METVTESNIESQRKAIRLAVEGAWGAVFELVNKIISAHERFGFQLIESRITPRFEDIQQSLRVMEAVIDAIVEAMDDYTCERMVLNVKQQIIHIERAITALKHGIEEDYESALSALKIQAQV